MLRAILADQGHQEQLDKVDFGAQTATQAAVAILVYPEIRDLGVIQDFRVLWVPSAPLVQQVVHFLYYSILLRMLYWCILSLLW